MSVAAKLKSPKADGIAWPEIAVYNDHIMQERIRRPCLNVLLRPTEAPEASHH